MFLLVSCATVKTQQGAENATDMQLQAISFSSLPGWQTDDQSGALAAFRNSCMLMMKRNDATPVSPAAIGGSIRGWRAPCNAAVTVANAKSFFETYFTPYAVQTSRGDTGLFTGYHEAILRGSLTKTAQYHVPLYRRPPDLVMVELGDFRDEMKGQRIAGYVTDGKLKPYASRAGIDNGALSNKGLELLWLDDANDAFFLAVQGSGRVYLNDGRVMRVGYDGQNGQPYYAIGRDLVARGALSKENVSLQSIRTWLNAHPGEAAALRQKNPSYVFFKILPENDGAVSGGPVGAQNVALTARRSLAVDPRFIPYGAPVFLNATHPVTGAPLQQLTIAQDTGGAIRGPVRGDLFWGSDAAAENAAGLMKSRGTMYVLLPKTLSGVLSIHY